VNKDIKFFSSLIVLLIVENLYFFIVSKFLLKSKDSSMEDGEEIDSNLRPFVSPLELEFQLHEKSEKFNLATGVRRLAVRTQNQIMSHLPLLK